MSLCIGGLPDKRDVKRALEKLKNGKAPGSSQRW